MRSKLFFIVLAVVVELFVAGLRAESPAPVIIQAQTGATAAAPAPALSQTGSNSTQLAIKLLEEMKSANDETLKKQQAALETLDELQKAAEQIKIFSKRG